MGALSQSRSLLARARQAAQRGQAMMEYSTITFLLLVGFGGLGIAMPLGPGGTLVQQLYGALQTYVCSLYYSLSLAAP